MKKYNVAIVGATGAVGEELVRVLEEVDFPINTLVPLASSKSVGLDVELKGKTYKVLELTEKAFEENDVEIAFFSAGGDISAHYAPYAAEAGAVVIDNTSHFRMDADVPLVVPECNPNDIEQWQNKGIIANPNCSTIQMVQVLKPLDELFNITRVDVATYQAVSGAGKGGMEELVNQMQDFFAFKLDQCEPKTFAHQIALNVIPHIDVFMDNAYTKEEMKMVNETQKILGKKMEISATCVRVPVMRSHSEAITIHFEKDVNLDKAIEALKNAENVIVIDNPAKKEYPMPIISTDTNDTYVGRIRKDINRDNVLHLWCVADQIRVGAATNAVRIAQKWIKLEEA
ncbi:aspartate-semialdehyde dehydrogenase [Sulfurospirillum barnesii]|uniref:Aspartate-semialdehyde dehydrogenase n=1 Tax=Sulfurospirillum barnesii (strain ATCC 700032 / DSM 10660 / SES-3) TaxID=760154 RepID=I3XUP0_SULBS|nr:aspartate-semialdehyde dehydrogenase [Sulfurospirillum barnesii]AFL67664.1 aspartate-semialdehyde dehydrogenase [Sulfurospirillum barnesii SES-3]